ncbi:32060_t:CDS:1, partial [Racocetra persica]
LYDHYLPEINADPNDIIGPTKKNSEEDNSNDDSIDDLEEDKEEKIRPNWIFLSEIDPNSHINISFDLGSRDIDINYNWASVSRQRYPNFEGADNFIQYSCDNTTVSENETDITINRKTLNEKQKLVFEQIESHYHVTLS